MTRQSITRFASLPSFRLKSSKMELAAAIFSFDRPCSRVYVYLRAANGSLVLTLSSAARLRIPSFRPSYLLFLSFLLRYSHASELENFVKLGVPPSPLVLLVLAKELLPFLTEFHWAIERASYILPLSPERRSHSYLSFTKLVYYDQVRLKVTCNSGIA